MSPLFLKPLLGLNKKKRGEGRVFVQVLMVEVEMENALSRGEPSEDGAFAFLHPGVVFHQLRVQEGIFGNAVLDPLHEPAGRGGRVGTAPGRFRAAKRGIWGWGKSCSGGGDPGMDPDPLGMMLGGTWGCFQLWDTAGREKSHPGLWF